jgi:hypothetical protein
MVKSRQRNIWNRFTVHYTSKHSSWLNQAEIEISILKKQYLGINRFSCIEELKASVMARKNRMNKRKVRFDWAFTTKKTEKISG